MPAYLWFAPAYVAVVLRHSKKLRRGGKVQDAMYTAKHEDPAHLGYIPYVLVHYCM